jgi:hypothetical protein
MELNTISETKKIIEEFQNEFNKINNNYYLEVLDFLNLLFSQSERKDQILKIKISKISLSDEIFEFYNLLIDKYKLKISKFNNKNFNFDEIYSFQEILEISLIMSNKLLEKLNYKIIKLNYNDKTTYKIIMK